MQTTRKKKYRIQPRLESGHRVPSFASMHPGVRDGLRAISRRENRSVSWVIHEIVADYFKLDIMGKKR